MKIRNAEPGDRDAWLELRNQLWPEDPETHLAEVGEYFGDGSHFVDQVYVAEQADRVVGFVELRLRDYAEGSDETRVPYVEGWYVDEPQRRRGVGRQLIERAEQWAKDLGYAELASDAQASNAGSIAAHHARGFREVEHAVCFLKHLGQAQRRPETGPVWAMCPVLGVSDVSAAAEFFRSKLGFEVSSIFEPLADEGAVYAIVERGEAEVHLQIRRRPLWSAPRERIENDAYVRVPDARALRDDLVARGAALHRDIEDAGYGMRDFTVEGPEGLRLTFGSRLSPVPP